MSKINVFDMEVKLLTFQLQIVNQLDRESLFKRFAYVLRQVLHCANNEGNANAGLNRFSAFAFLSPQTQ